MRMKNMLEKGGVPCSWAWRKRTIRNKNL